ncbi:MAG: hypothetical protein AMDU1_APLC00081G0005 [Thermoplasmatales archaeon A-plasma]|nr:MAG: hypothetical protein AMDU1_APLC00081G0005 [Thermoplasmatales archaeon A-plasma]
MANRQRTPYRVTISNCVEYSCQGNPPILIRDDGDYRVKSNELWLSFIFFS